MTNNALLKFCFRVIYDRKEALDKIFKLLGLATAFVGCVTTLFMPSQKEFLISIVTTVFVLYIVWDWYKYLVGQDFLPPVAEIVPKIMFRIKAPSWPELNQAIEIAQQEFGKAALRPEVVREVYKRIPHAFLVAININSDKVVGYVDWFIIKNRTKFDKYANGEINEADFSVDDFCGIHDYDDECVFYIGGIVVAENNIFTRGKITQSLICGISEFLSKNMFSSRDKISVFSAAVTNNGKKLLERMEFVPVTQKNNRNTITYSREFTMKSAARVCREFQLCKYFADINNKN